MRLSVPGNLLLLGEYAVSDPGGLGLALAVERRVVLELEPASTLSVHGSWGGAGVSWSEGSPAVSPLVEAVVRTWREQLPAARGARAGGQAAGRVTPGESPVGGARISIDSSALFFGDRKGGFGSSAAVSVALTCALLHLCGLRGEQLIRSAARVALLAHRRAQGGRGSGYDVCASLYGGVGCLTGGAEPSWQAVALPWLPPLYLFRGRSSVSTAQALLHYERWKHSDPRGWRAFLEQSNRAVRSFVRAQSWARARRSFLSFKELGLELGRRIGVSADIEAPSALAPELYKAVGAGDELGICLTEAPPQAPGLEPVAVAPEGVRWST